MSFESCAPTRCVQPIARPESGGIGADALCLIHEHSRHPRNIIVEITDQLEESFVPFEVDIVVTPKFKGCFAEQVRKKATLWM